MAEEHGEIQMDGNPCPLPLCADEQDWAMVHDWIVSQPQITRWRFRSSPLAQHPDASAIRAAFLEYGFRDISWRTRLVDLALTEAELWRGIRKSYHSLIHAGEKRLCLNIACNVDDLHGCHAAAAGRDTRPPATWEFMQRWLNEKAALLVTARDPCNADAVVGAAYWYVWKGAAYYGSAAYLVDNVAHAVIWRSLQALRGLGVRRVEMGWQGHATDEKGRHIEFFKRGFGGEDVPLVVVERTR